MVTTSRRDLILSAAVAGAAFGVDRSLAIAAPATAQKAPEPARGFFRYTIGEAAGIDPKKIETVLISHFHPDHIFGLLEQKNTNHAPGHTAFHVSSGNEQLMISSDAAYVPAQCAAHPGWHGVFDQDAALAEVSRRKLLDRAIADKMLICGSHFPWPGLGKIARDGTGYALTLHTA
jgi:glyoxylase-like metal-dependent hydrolase (beta-lactamase superfamily II)